MLEIVDMIESENENYIQYSPTNIEELFKLINNLESQLNISGSIFPVFDEIKLKIPKKIKLIDLTQDYLEFSGLENPFFINNSNKYCYIHEKYPLGLNLLEFTTNNFLNEINLSKPIFYVPKIMDSTKKFKNSEKIFLMGFESFEYLGRNYKFE